MAWDHSPLQRVDTWEIQRKLRGGAKIWILFSSGSAGSLSIVFTSRKENSYFEATVYFSFYYIDKSTFHFFFYRLFLLFAQTEPWKSGKWRHQYPLRPIPVKHSYLYIQSINGGYYMAAQRYEICLRVLKNISRVSAGNEWNIFQHEKRNFVSPSDHVIFFLLYKILTIFFILYFKN